MKKLLLFAMIFNLLSMQIIFADEGEELCTTFKIQLFQKSELEKSIFNLIKLKDVSEEIQAKLDDDENSRMVKNLAEAIEAQSSVESLESVKGHALGGASLGAMLLSSLMIQKSYKADFKNAKFLELIKTAEGWEKFKAMHVPLKRRVLFSIAALAVAGTIYQFSEGLSHGAEEKRLGLLLIKVNKLLELANNLTPLKERLNSISAKLEETKEKMKDLHLTCSESIER
jgi:hypothetical protein